MNLGATPVMVDVEAPFHMSAARLAAAITPRTKAVIPVDLGGWPCDYPAIHEVLSGSTVTRQFRPNSPVQAKLRRPLVLADAAHSLGAQLDGVSAGNLTDVTVFSFHSVKNLTTGEGGMICLRLPADFDMSEEQRVLKYLALNGQTKTALEKSTVGGWKYDIVAQGFKANMPDICAAIGLAQLRQYADHMLPERGRIFAAYNEAFRDCAWAEVPPMTDERRQSSLHLYQLRVRGIHEAERNEMMKLIGEQGIGVNVHYVPMPMLTLFRDRGFRIEDYPQTFELYENEITLPVYNGLQLADVARVAAAVKSAYHTVASS
jgi:dTDP-4-amino-4,6-dideoxygalactose transaminase